MLSLWCFVLFSSNTLPLRTHFLFFIYIFKWAVFMSILKVSGTIYMGIVHWKEDLTVLPFEYVYFMTYYFHYIVLSISPFVMSEIETSWGHTFPTSHSIFLFFLYFPKGKKFWSSIWKILYKYYWKYKQNCILNKYN